MWEFAISQGFTIVSKDADFRQRSLVKGPPPKVIGLLVGNCTTGQIEQVMRDRIELIRQIAADELAAFLELP